MADAVLIDNQEYEKLDLSGDKPPAVPVEQALQSVDHEEAEGMVSLPSIDVGSAQHSLGSMVMSGFADSLVNQFVDMPATATMLIGRMREEEDAGRPGVGKPFQIKVAEKIRDFSLALRAKMNLQAEQIEPQNFGEKVAQGVGNMGGSLISMLGASIVGAGAGGAAAGPGGAVVGGVVAPYVSSYAVEKANLAKEMLDAGYDAHFVNNISDLYAFPVAALDFASFRVAGRLLRPAVSRAVKTTAGKFFAKAAISSAGQVIRGGAQEGGIEAVQGAIQNEFEVNLKLKDRNFQEDLSNRVVEFIVGGLMGSAAGTVGQLTTRRTTISKIVEETKLPRNEAARLYDEACLRANDMVYDELISATDVSQQMKTINDAFEKIAGRKGVSGEPVSPVESELYTATQRLEEQVAVDEKSAALPRQFGALYEERAKIQQQLDRLDESGIPAAKDQAGTAYGALQEKLKTIESRLTELKVSQSEMIAKNPTLTNIQQEMDALTTEWKDAPVEERRKIEDRLRALAFRLQNPGTIQDTVKVGEAKVEAIQNTALKTLDEISRYETDLAMATEEQSAGIKEQIKNLESEYVGHVSELMATEKMTEGFRQEVSRLEGNVSLSVGQVRQLAKSKLREVLTAYKTGRQLSELEFKTVQKAFITLLRDSNLSPKAKALLLRKVLTVRTAAQFNDKRGLIMDSVNSVLRGEQVKGLQELGKDLLDKMMPSKQNVSPAAQKFAEHLKRVYREGAPLEFDPSSSDMVAMGRAQVEQAVYDLRHAGDDVGGALRATEVIKDFYKDQLQKFSDFKASQDQTYTRLAKMVADGVSKGKGLDVLKESLNAVREKGKRQGIFRTIAPTPYTVSFMTILDKLDIASGFKTMQGPLVREFSSEKPFQAWVAHTDWAKTNIDGKLTEIYGKKALNVWRDFIGQDFLDVEVNTPEGATRKINIPRSAAMTLYMMTKMPAIRKSIIDMGISEGWLTKFELGENVNFSEADHKWMSNLRDVLDMYADKIAPVYEKLTGKPFRRVDNYFMIQRYLARTLEEGGIADNTSVIDSMLKGDFEKLSATESEHFKQRVKSKEAMMLPDIFQAVSHYALDMNHFLGYAEYVTKLQKAFQGEQVKKLMSRDMDPGLPPVINEFIRTLSQGSATRTADRQAMKGFFQLLGWYARSQIAAAKNIPRQFSGLAAFTQYKGVGAAELSLGAADLPRAHKSGELRELLDTSYMRQRFEGLYEFAAQYAQDMAHAEWFSALRDRGPAGAVRRAMTSQQLNSLITASARYGDRWASVVGGWTVYKKFLSETGNKTLALERAIRAIEDTQQSMDPGKLPVAFNRSDVPNRLLTIFQRTPTIYLDQYLRMWEAKKAGRIDNAQFIRSMITYHVWIPLFEVMMTTGQGPQDTPWQTGLAMAAGPFAYALILGQALTSIAAGVVEGATDNEAEIPQYLKDTSSSTLVGSFTRDITKAIKTATEFMRYPDFENMWTATKAAGQVGDISPLPTGWLIQTPEAIYDIFMSGDTDTMIEGVKLLMGYSETRAKAGSK